MFCDTHRHRNVLFISTRAIQTTNIYLINDKKSNKWLSICRITEIIDVLVIKVTLNMMINYQNVYRF